MKQFGQKLTFFFFMITISFYLSNCGSNRVILRYNPDDPVLQNKVLKRENARVVLVSDNRPVEPEYAGTAQTGMFNKKVPYLLDEPVSKFITESINELLATADTTDSILPIGIQINQFQVSEKTFAISEYGYFDCQMNFYFPVTRDSFAIARISDHQSVKRSDVTGSLKNLIYTGIFNCTKQFVEEFYDSSPKYFISTRDTLQLADIKSIYARSFAVQKEDTTKQIVYQSPYVTKSYLKFGILRGDKIKTGYQVAYNLYRYKRTSNLHFGVGYTANYFDLANVRDYWLLEGKFINFGAQFLTRYFLTPNGKGVYLAGAIFLTGGVEKINYGYDEEENFFYGPVFTERIGLNIENRILLEAGLFQLKLFGSKLLPSDMGYKLSIGIGL